MPHHHIFITLMANSEVAAGEVEVLEFNFNFSSMGQLTWKLPLATEDNDTMESGGAIMDKHLLKWTDNWITKLFLFDFIM